MKRKPVWLGDEDDLAIPAIKDRYGCESDSQAMRLALRVWAGSPRLQIQLPPRPTHTRRSPKIEGNPDHEGHEDL